jgi:hypothetical protein
MDFKSILKTVGGGLISSLVPGGSAIVAGINAFLPDDKKLPENATGIQAQDAINSLPPETQAQVLCKEHDVTIEEIRGFTNRFQAMCDVDKTGNTLRPQVIMMMAICVMFAIFVTVSFFAYAVVEGDDKLITAITNGWPFIVGVLAIPGALLRSYFGLRTKEKQQKYEATTGVSSPLGVLGQIASSFKR